MMQSNQSGNGDSVVKLLQHYLKLEATEKLSLFATFLVVALVVFAIGTCALFYICAGLIIYLGKYVGGESLADMIVGAVLVVLIVVFCINRRTFVERPILRWVSGLMLDNNDKESDE